MNAVVDHEVTLSKSVRQFISQPKKLLIGGKWMPAESGKTFAVQNPATGEVITQAAEGDKTDIDKAVKAARLAFESGLWPAMSPSERGRLTIASAI